MKKTFLFLAVIALGASACSQYTCPTYAKVEKAPATTVVVKTQK